MSKKIERFTHRIRQYKKTNKKQDTKQSQKDKRMANKLKKMAVQKFAEAIDFFKKEDGYDEDDEDDEDVYVWTNEELLRFLTESSKRGDEEHLYIPPAVELICFTVSRLDKNSKCFCDNFYNLAYDEDVGVIKTPIKHKDLTDERFDEYIKKRDKQMNDMMNKKTRQ